MTNLLRDPNDQFDYNGVFAGYIDDLNWAATFDKMVEVIKFVLERGPSYGYKLNLKKSILLAVLAMTIDMHLVHHFMTALIFEFFGSPSTSIGTSTSTGYLVLLMVKHD